MGTVSQLPVQARTCSRCENGYLGANGVYCIVFAEIIWNEVEAAVDCPEWEES